MGDEGGGVSFRADSSCEASSETVVMFVIGVSSSYSKSQKVYRKNVEGGLQGERQKIKRLTATNESHNYVGVDKKQGTVGRRGGYLYAGGTWPLGKVI